jgi:6-phosphogluconolactonase (cycloisomerase 2 family)
MRLCAKNGATNVARRPVVAGRRIVLAAIVGLAALVILSGCGSFFSSSSSLSHLGFVVGGVTDVSAYRIDNKSGNASSIVTAPYVAGNSPSSVVVHPSNQFLYVANAADSTISLFSINSTSGTLTEVLPRTSAGGFSPGFMTMDSGGKFLFVANQVSNDVCMFQIGAAGTLTLVSTVSVGSGPAGLALSSAGFLYVPVPNFSSIAVLNTGSGILQFVGPYSISTGVAGIAVDPGAKFLYATNPASNTVSVFAIQAGGGLVAMPALTVATGTTPVAVALNLPGSALYVANTGSATVSQFTINSTGALTAFATTSVIAGTSPAFLAVDPGGKFIFVGNTGSNSITEYSINADESLTNGNTISVAFVPRSFAVTQ